MNPMAAVRAVTIKAARHLRLYDRGAIAPGKVADIVLLASSLADFVPETVIARGELVVEDGRPLWSADSASLPEDARAVWSQTVKLPRQRPQDFHLLPPVTEGTVRCRLIWAHEGKTTTEEGIATLSVSQGSIDLDDVIVEHGGVTSVADLAYIAVCDRHGQTGERAIGLIANLGLRSGAIASTIAHDAHNLLVIGRSPEDMATAANAVIDSQGGLAVARGGQLLAHVALPLAGLMADEPVPSLARKLSSWEQALREVGITCEFPLMRLTVLSLPVSSGLRLTNRGLVDTRERRLVSMWLP
jgi:adenine deaminase